MGVSLYTWTSIIGVILARLSLGNWFGGVWAHNGGDETAAGATLVLGGLASLAILLLLTVIAPGIQATTLNLLSSSFLYVLSLFVSPALLLGVITATRRGLSPMGNSLLGTVGCMLAISAQAELWKETIWWSSALEWCGFN